MRIKELKRLKEELSEEEYAELKGAMWVFTEEGNRLDNRRQSIT